MVKNCFGFCFLLHVLGLGTVFFVGGFSFKDYIQSFLAYKVSMEKSVLR